MNTKIKRCIEKILSLRVKKDSEENIKIKMVVPLLQCLGHDLVHLEFEYGSKPIDIFIKNLPLDNRVFIETKGYGKKPTEYILKQIRSYAREVGALLSILINESAIRFYVNEFTRIPIYEINWENLLDERNLKVLISLLSRDCLVSGKTRKFIKSEVTKRIKTAKKTKQEYRYFQKILMYLERSLKPDDVIPLKIKTPKGAIHEANSEYCLIERIDEKRFRYRFEDTDKEVGDFEGWSFDDLIILVEKINNKEIRITIEDCKSRYYNSLLLDNKIILARIGGPKNRLKGQRWQGKISAFV